jgi:hypothetical protein
MKPLDELTARQREAYEHHRAGRYPAQIARAMDISYRRTIEILRGVGIRPRRHYAPKGHTKRPLPKATRAERATMTATRRAQVRAVVSAFPDITAAAVRARLPSTTAASLATIRADVCRARKELAQ